MRIISKFHDYYDTAMGHGQDPNTVYMRVPSLVPMKGWKWDNRFVEILNHGHLGSDLYANLGVIGFCGRCYPVWMDLELRFDEESLTSNTSATSSLNIDDLIKQVSSTYSELPTTFRQSKKRLIATARYIEETVRKAYDAAETFKGTEVDDAVFRELDCPLFVLVGRNYWKVRNPQNFNGTVIKNPRLATLGFQTVADSFSAFQEIAMYLGSALAKEPIAPDTVGDDELIAKSKGFDEKSFRTAAPGQKKLNRKRNREAKRRNE